MVDKAFTLDLTNYKDRRGSRVEPGKYEVVVEDVESNKSNAGNPYLSLYLRVESGTHEGETLLDRLVLTEKSLWRVVAFLQAIGVPTPKKRLSVPYRTLIGRRLVVEVEDGEPYNGQVRSEVRGYLRSAKQTASTSDLGDLPEADDEETVDVPAPSVDEAGVSVDGGGVEEISLDDIEI